MSQIIVTDDGEMLTSYSQSVSLITWSANLAFDLYRVPRLSALFSHLSLACAHACLKLANIAYVSFSSTWRFREEA